MLEKSNLSRNLKILLKRTNMTIPQLAKWLDIKDITLRSYLNNESIDPSYESIFNISKQLFVYPYDLMWEEHLYWEYQDDDSIDLLLAHKDFYSTYGVGYPYVENDGSNCICVNINNIVSYCKRYLNISSAYDLFCQVAVFYGLDKINESSLSLLLNNKRKPRMSFVVDLATFVYYASEDYYYFNEVMTRVLDENDIKYVSEKLVKDYFVMNYRNGIIKKDATYHRLLPDITNVSIVPLELSSLVGKINAHVIGGKSNIDSIELLCRQLSHFDRAQELCKYYNYLFCEFYTDYRSNYFIEAFKIYEQDKKKHSAADIILHQINNPLSDYYKLIDDLNNYNKSDKKKLPTLIYNPENLLPALDIPPTGTWSVNNENSEIKRLVNEIDNLYNYIFELQEILEKNNIPYSSYESTNEQDE